MLTRLKTPCRFDIYQKKRYWDKYQKRLFSHLRDCILMSFATSIARCLNLRSGQFAHRLAANHM